MLNLDQLLTSLSNDHRQALKWFFKNAAKDISWPTPLQGEAGAILLASKAKGIYKPKGSPYALSVRQNLSGPYADKDPIFREDGTWMYAYFQENEDPQKRDTEYTNVGLMCCLRDRVPVGVFRQTQGKPYSTYRVLGLALVAGWDNGYFYLEGLSQEGLGRLDGTSTQIEMTIAAENIDYFDPKNLADGRKRAIVQVAQRQGQAKFRRSLLDAYQNRCAMSDCDVVEALEAAHIVPYLGDETNHTQNGLILRADLHTLFDLGLLAVDTREYKVVVSPSLSGSSYAKLAGRKLRLPKEVGLQPSKLALDHQRAWAML